MTVSDDILKEKGWSEGSYVEISRSPTGSNKARHATIAICTEHGFKKAIFADGVEHKFTTVQAITDHASDNYLLTSGHVLPRFPNGDVLMILVRRPGIAFGEKRPTNTLQFLDGRESIEIDETLSLETPGGSVDPTDSSVQVGILRELIEETEVNISDDHEVVLHTRKHVVHPAIAEMILTVRFGVLDIPEVDFPTLVDNDGGIRVVRLSHDEVQANRRSGLITASSALEHISFLRDVTDPIECAEMKKAGLIQQVHSTFGRLR